MRVFFLYNLAMDKFIIKGPARLAGTVQVSRSKNAYLPIMAATLMCQRPVLLKNVPQLRDIQTMLKLLRFLGATIEQRGSDYFIDTTTANSFYANYELVSTMRASIFVLGPLLARFGQAIVSLPGGCAIGTRPIDIHLTNLEKMGAQINLAQGNVQAAAKNLRGCELVLSFPSVGATENIMMAAVGAPGTTVINNAAREPEIADLAQFLNQMGAQITGAGTDTISIVGSTTLGGGEYQAMGDRIEAATYLIAGLITHSPILVEGINPTCLKLVIDKLREMGAQLECTEHSIRCEVSHLRGTSIDTAPFPGFPTDLQAQMMALMCTLETPSVISEHIFENRFMHVPELGRLGAQISLRGSSAFIEGGKILKSAPVMCTDLRASAALVLAALAADGETHLHRVYHIDRGYEKIDQKLTALGAEIRRVPE